MKTTKFLSALLLFLAGTLLFSSCIIRGDEYVTPEQPGYRNVLNDNFNYDAYGWTINDPANRAYATVQNGVYKLSYLMNNGSTYTSAIGTGINPNRNFLIQTRIKSDNEMGLLFGASSYHYGYSFFVDNQGYFAMYDEGSYNTAPRKILDWQYTNVLNRTGWNDLEIEQYNGYWYGYINGTKVFTIASYPVSGSQVGFIVLANTTGYADYLTVQW